MVRAKEIDVPQGRVIVLIDESGLSERPWRARAWAPKGEASVLQYRFSWKQLSVIAGISPSRFYFRLFDGSIKCTQLVEVLKALQATISKTLLIIWDGLQGHRSKLVRAQMEVQRGRIVLERLPARAPEMNPVECIWGHLKHHTMRYHCAGNFAVLARPLGGTCARYNGTLRSEQHSGNTRRSFGKVSYLRKTQYQLAYNILQQWLAGDVSTRGDWRPKRLRAKKIPWVCNTVIRKNQLHLKLPLALLTLA